MRTMLPYMLTLLVGCFGPATVKVDDDDDDDDISYEEVEDDDSGDTTGDIGDDTGEVEDDPEDDPEDDTGEVEDDPEDDPEDEGPEYNFVSTALTDTSQGTFLHVIPLTDVEDAYDESWVRDNAHHEVSTCFASLENDFTGSDALGMTDTSWCDEDSNPTEGEITVMSDATLYGVFVSVYYANGGGYYLVDVSLDDPGIPSWDDGQDLYQDDIWCAAIVDTVNGTITPCTTGTGRPLIY